MEEFVKIVTLSLASLIEGMAALIVAQGILKTLVHYLRHAIRGDMDNLAIRLSLGKVLALALEFLLAADIVRSAVAPTWEDIGKLAAIAALRTLLNYFLEREFEHK